MDLDSVRLKLAYDLEYVRRIGLWLDLRICWATAFKVAGASFETIARVFRFREQDAIVGQYRKQVQDDKPRRPQDRPSDRPTESQLEPVGS